MKPQIVRRQVAGKVVPPVMVRSAVQLSGEGTTSSHRTHQAQFSHFIWHRNKFSLFQMKKKTLEVCPGMPDFFPPSSTVTPRCAQHKPHLTSRCTWLIQTVSTVANKFSPGLYSCFSAGDRILLPSLCLNFAIYWKGFFALYEAQRGRILPLGLLCWNSCSSTA